MAEYVAVPFERKAEVAVGGQYPVHLFKKMAILKWGNQEERYQEYKKHTLEFIIEDFDDPREKDDAQLYKDCFESIVYHLENEPNPFEKEVT